MMKFLRRIVHICIHERKGFIPHITKLCGGFTLIELLVVLVVTTALSTFLIIYNHTSRQQIALYVEEAKLVQVISRAKSLSLSTYRESSSEVICGYGVHIDYVSMNYTLFSYTKPANVECEEITSIDLGAERAISTFSLSKELVFIAVLPGGGARIDDLIFIPPAPVTLMSSEGSLISNGFGKIALGTQDGSAGVVVMVSSAGQITF